MTERFFVEFRPWRGKYISAYAESRNKRLMILGSERIKPPHMTLYGPSETNDLGTVARAVVLVARNFELVKIRAAGFGYFNNPDKKWVVLNIQPNQKLEDLRNGLYQELSKLSPPRPSDKEPQFKFHVSIGKTISAKTYGRLCKKVNQWTCPDIEQFLLRICIIDSRGKINCEYDLPQKLLLNRKESLSGNEKRRTLSALRKLLGKPVVSPRHVFILSGIRRFLKRLFR